MGFPYVRGYQPRGNCQGLLETVVEQQLRVKAMLDQAALAAVQQPAIAPVAADFSRVLTDAPARQHRASEASATPGFKPARRDHLEREAQNQSLGLAGEQFALDYERWAFFVTQGELQRSDSAREQFHLYRLFEFRKAPRLFDLQGAIAAHCLLDPVSYRASFG